MKIEPLTNADRCDRCGGRATVAFDQKNTKTRLMFCGHHTLQFKDALRVSALTIWDVRGEVIRDKELISAL